MDVLSSKTISEKDAAKILQKFVDAKEEEENTDLMVRCVCTALRVHTKEACAAAGRAAELPSGAAATVYVRVSWSRMQCVNVSLFCCCAACACR